MIGKNIFVLVVWTINCLYASTTFTEIHSRLALGLCMSHGIFPSYIEKAKSISENQKALIAVKNICTLLDKYKKPKEEEEVSLLYEAFSEADFEFNSYIDDKLQYFNEPSSLSQAFSNFFAILGKSLSRGIFQLYTDELTGFSFPTIFNSETNLDCLHLDSSDDFPSYIVSNSILNVKDQDNSPIPFRVNVKYEVSDQESRFINATYLLDFIFIKQDNFDQIIKPLGHGYGNALWESCSVANKTKMPGIELRTTNNEGILQNIADHEVLYFYRQAGSIAEASYVLFDPIILAGIPERPPSTGQRILRQIRRTLRSLTTFNGRLENMSFTHASLILGALLLSIPLAWGSYQLLMDCILSNIQPDVIDRFLTALASAIIRSPFDFFMIIFYLHLIAYTILRPPAE